MGHVSSHHLYETADTLGMELVVSGHGITGEATRSVELGKGATVAVKLELTDCIRVKNRTYTAVQGPGNLALVVIADVTARIEAPRVFVVDRAKLKLPIRDLFLALSLNSGDPDELVKLFGKSIRATFEQQNKRWQAAA